MKKLHLLSLIIIGSVTMTACKKVEGPGGTSSITGVIQGTDQGSSSVADQEITSIVVTHANGVDGSILDNSDYFLLNTVNGNNYYVWYENTNWLGQDPGLSGRTGIKVTYSNTDSNVTIATNTAAAITAAASADFDVSLSGDIVTVTNIIPGEVVDADEVNTPFIVDILNQGSDANSDPGATGPIPMVEERVYIVYGDNDFYGESVRTDANGNYQFKGLTKGSYRVYAFSKNPNDPYGAKIQVEVSAEITDKKQVVSAPQIDVIY